MGTGPAPGTDLSDATRKGPRWPSFLLAALWLLWLIPVVQTTYLSETCTSPCPLWDDWNLVGKPLAKSLSGISLTFQDYWEPYVHSRAPLPKALCLSLAQWSHWDVKWGTRTTLFLTLATLGAVFWLIVRRSAFTRWEQPLVAAAAAFLIFNPFQQTPWYFGVMASNAMGLTPVILCTVLWTTRWPFGRKLALSLVLTLVASLSMITGLVLWLIPPFLLWWAEPGPSKKVRALCTVGWFLLFGAFLAIYLHEFNASQNSRSFGDALPRWRDILDFVLTMLGHSAGYLPTTPPNAGLRVSAVSMANCLILSLLGMVAVNARFFFSAAGFRQALPWFVFMGYGAVYSLMVALNQLDIGNAEFLTRYVAYTVFFYIGWLGVVRLGLREAFRAGAMSPARRTGAWAIAGVCLLVFSGAVAGVTLSYQQGLRKSTEVYYKGMTSRGAIEFATTCPNWEMLNEAAWTNAATIIACAPPIAEAGLLGPGIVKSPLLTENKRWPVGDQGNQFLGELEKLTPKGKDELLVRGWALEKTGHPPDLVVVTAFPEGDESQERVVSIEMERVKRKDIVKRFGHNEYTGRYGWTIKVQRARLPAGNAVVRAYAFDTDTLAFHQLADEKTLSQFP